MNSTHNSGCLIVGEIAQAHDGSLGTAHAYIDSIARAGADAVKFQTHIASAESTPAEEWRVQFSRQDASRYDYWKRMEFTEEQWLGLRQHAEERGLKFLSSPFSVAAAELLRRIGVHGWKIASGEVNNELLLTAILDSSLPVLLSTGMSTLAEIDQAVKAIKAASVPLTVLQCSSLYPCPPEKIGLNMIALYKDRYRCPVGLSDHSGRIYPGLAAATLGINALEVHVTLSRESFGPDVSVSLTTEELRQLVEGVRFIETAMVHEVNKDAMADELDSIRKTFMKSIVAVAKLKAGTVLEPKHLAVKKPGRGLPPSMLSALIGKRLNRDVVADEILVESDLADPS